MARFQEDPIQIILSFYIRTDNYYFFWQCLCIWAWN